MALKKVSIFAIILFSIFSLTAEGFLSFQRKCFELIRYDITGYSLLSNDFSGNSIEHSKPLRSFTVSVLKRPLKYNVLGIKDGLVADVFFENASTIIFSTFCEDDLKSVETEYFDIEKLGDEKNSEFSNVDNKNFKDNLSRKIDWVDEVLLTYRSENLVSKAKSNKNDIDWSEYSLDGEEPEYSENISEKDSEKSVSKNAGDENKNNLEKNAETVKENEENDSSETSEKIIPEYLHLEKGNKLRRFSYDDENFSVKNAKGDENNSSDEENNRFENDSENIIDKNIIISKVGSIFKRKFFNGNYQLEKVESWEQGSSAVKTKLLSIKTYEYKDDGVTLNEILEKYLRMDSGYLLNEITDKNYEKEILYRYADNGKVSEKKLWHYEIEKIEISGSENPDNIISNSESIDNVQEKNSEGTGSSGHDKSEGKNIQENVKKVIDSEESWKYDEENRIIEERKILYNYSVDFKKQKVTEKTDMKNVYIYGRKSSVPDSKYYENGELRVETVYKNQEDYMKTMYFGDGVIMEVFYEKGIKATETLKMAGKVVRRRTF